MHEAIGRKFTAAEQAAFEPPDCPDCGTRTEPHWEETTDRGSTERTWTPTLFTCMSCNARA